MKPRFAFSAAAAILLLQLPLRAQAPAATAAPPAAPVATPAPPAVPAQYPQYRTADDLWMYIQAVKKGPAIPPKDPADIRRAMATMIVQLYAASTDFVNRFPADPRYWDAVLMRIQSESIVGQISGHPNPAATIRELADLGNQLSAPAAIRSQAGYELLDISMREFVRGDRSITPAGIVDQLKKFTLDFPSYPGLDTLKYHVAETLNGYDSAAAQTLFTELANSGQGNIADDARKQIATIERLKSPIDLHFADVDGTPVDLSGMRGKVVLIYFWATWCGPAKQDTPMLLDAYQKLHARGFEIVGISLDRSKRDLNVYRVTNGLTWPQYFDGKGWQNNISSDFGIQAIPTMWLVNKNGYVVSTTPRTDLVAEVGKLLAEK